MQSQLPHSPCDREKDPAHVVSGLRAALNNPRVSKLAKERAARKLDGCEGVGVEMPEEIERAARTLSEDEEEDDIPFDDVTLKSEFIATSPYLTPIMIFV